MSSTNNISKLFYYGAIACFFVGGGIGIYSEAKSKDAADDTDTADVVVSLGIAALLAAKVAE